MQTAHDSERGLLGLLIVWGDFVRESRHALEPEMFDDHRNRDLWRIIASMDAGGAKVDLISVTQALKAAGTFQEIGGVEFLDSLTKQSIPRENISHHVAEIRRAYYARNMVRVASIITKDPTDELVAELQRHALARAAESGDRLFEFSRDIPTYVASLEPEKADAAKAVMASGFPKLDKALGGLKRGDLMTISARPGGGKTAFMTMAATNLADSGARVLMFTTEMSAHQLMGRIMPYKSRVKAWRFRKLILEGRHYKAVADAAATMGQYQMWICDKPRPSLADIQATIMRVNPDVVVIDYLQRILKPRAENVTRAVDEIMASLKSFCIERKVLGLLGCQMNRIVDREKGMPRLSDLRDGGAIESESDQVLLLHTDVQASTESTIKIVGLLEKNRHGTTATVDFLLQRELIEIMEDANGEPGTDQRRNGGTNQGATPRPAAEQRAKAEGLPGLRQESWIESPDERF